MAQLPPRASSSRPSSGFITSFKFDSGCYSSEPLFFISTISHHLQEAKPHPKSPRTKETVTIVSCQSCCCRPPYLQVYNPPLAPPLHRLEQRCKQQVASSTLPLYTTRGHQPSKLEDQAVPAASPFSLFPDATAGRKIRPDGRGWAVTSHNLPCRQLGWGLPDLSWLHRLHEAIRQPPDGWMAGSLDDRLPEAHRQLPVMLAACIHGIRGIHGTHCPFPARPLAEGGAPAEQEGNPGWVHSCNCISCTRL